MQFQLYSQLVRLDLSNDHLLKMYCALYDEIPVEDAETAENVAQLILVREKIGLELKAHLFDMRNAIGESRVVGSIFECLPRFLKLEYLARHTFANTDWEICYEKERKNVKLYYETLYNQCISSATVDILLKQKRKLESSFPR